MAVDLAPTSMGCLDPRAQLRARDVHVSLKGRGSLIAPVVHEPHRILRPAKLVQLGRVRTYPFEIRPRDVDLWPRHLAGVAPFLQGQVRVSCETPRRSNRRGSAGEIE